MLVRAWRRMFAALLARPASLVAPNLAASAALGLLTGLAFAAARLAGHGPLALLPRLAWAWAAWLAAAWLAFQARAALEGGELGLREGLRRWWRARRLERSLAFVALAAAALWLRLALGFYRGLEGALAALAWGLAALLSLWLAAAAMVSVGLSSREEPRPRAEWKAAALMPLAFAPQCLAALLLAGFAAGGAALGLGLGHALARLLWLPALALPLVGAACIAAFFVALSDEFLARSLGQEAPPLAAQAGWRDFFRPWR